MYTSSDRLRPIPETIAAYTVAEEAVASFGILVNVLFEELLVC